MANHDTNCDPWFRRHLLPHLETLKGWLRHRFPQERDIEDIAQEAVLKTWTAHLKRPLDSPKSFLFTAARNHAINQSQRAKVRGENVLVKMEALDVLDSGTDVAEQVARQQELEVLEQAIASLPKRCREIFTLRKVHGLSQKEIADRLGLSVHTVYAQLSIGFHKCAEFVERHQDKDLK